MKKSSGKEICFHHNEKPLHILFFYKKNDNNAIQFFFNMRENKYKISFFSHITFFYFLTIQTHLKKIILFEKLDIKFRATPKLQAHGVKNKSNNHMRHYIKDKNIILLVLFIYFFFFYFFFFFYLKKNICRQFWKIYSCDDIIPFNASLLNFISNWLKCKH